MVAASAFGYLPVALAGGVLALAGVLLAVLKVDAVVPPVAQAAVPNSLAEVRSARRAPSGGGVTNVGS